ncbi:MAG: hypothetical protein R3C68_04480 [Myxococcota bacterium]
MEETLVDYTHAVGRVRFQISPIAADRMFRIAHEMAGTGRLCLEDMRGLRALTLPLSETFTRVIAVEDNAEAVRMLQGHGLEIRTLGYEAVHAKAETTLVAMLGELRPDAVVLDPPRKGVGPEISQALGASQTPRVVLLSCDPQALATDLRALIEPVFHLRQVVPIDQFPRSAHVESVVLLER